jgi:predicted RNA binding protein YcfA (HicA-like mRNA interferase family)
MLRLQTEAMGCVVPLHDELALGTLRGMCRQAQVSLDDLYLYL